MSSPETKEEYEARMKKLADESKSEDDISHMFSDLQERLWKIEKEINKRALKNENLKGFSYLMNGIDNNIVAVRKYFNLICFGE